MTLLLALCASSKAGAAEPTLPRSVFVLKSNSPAITPGQQRVAPLPAPKFVIPKILTNSGPVILGTNNILEPYAPGLYKSEPYTCLVLVPGSHLDEKMVIGRKPAFSPPSGTAQLRTIKPDLRLVPWPKRDK